MIQINAFLHRRILRDLIVRWMLDRLEPTDTLSLMRLVLFNSVYVARYLPMLSQELLGQLHDCCPSRGRSFDKGDLKDRLIAYRPAKLRGTTPAAVRVRALINAYRAQPGRFFRETPFRGTLYYALLQGQNTYVGSSRIKRIRRLAEKSARKVVAWLHDTSPLPHALQEESLASHAANAAHPPSACLEHLEAELLCWLRATPQDQWPDDIEINDLAGLKVIIEPDEETRLLEILAALGCVLREREPHTGAYHALNLVVEHRPDKGRILAQPLPSKVLMLFQEQGVQPEAVRRAFESFVHSGEDAVQVEIICSDYAQALEGEIGRCMHEDRIIRQRHHPHHSGQLALNVEFLLELLFTLPVIPRAHLEQLPIRLWNRYLPDYFDEVKRGLFHLPSIELELE